MFHSGHSEHVKEVVKLYREALDVARSNGPRYACDAVKVKRCMSEVYAKLGWYHLEFISYYI